MTIPQIKGFLEAIAKKEATRHAQFISDVAVGAQCDGKTIKKTIKNYVDRAVKKSTPSKPAPVNLHETVY